MLAVISVVSLVLLFFLILPMAENDWRSALLRSAIIWSVALTIITEGLSLFRLLSPVWVAGAWGLFSMVLFLIYRQSYKGYRKPRFRLAWDAGYKVLTNPYIRTSLIGLIIIISLIGLTALIAPPNTNDSMGYHMPRVVHWIQNRSVAHYPTHYTAQLYLSPWSAFAILNLQVLSGGDRSFRESMIGATQQIKLQQCTDIGLSFYYLRVFEYPIWALLQQDSYQTYRLQHIGITNKSQVKSSLPSFRDFQPCLVLNDTRSDFENTFLQGRDYREIWSVSPLHLLAKDN